MREKSREKVDIINIQIHYRRKNGSYRLEDQRTHNRASAKIYLILSKKFAGLDKINYVRPDEIDYIHDSPFPNLVANGESSLEDFDLYFASSGKASLGGTRLSIIT